MPDGGLGQEFESQPANVNPCTTIVEQHIRFVNIDIDVVSPVFPHSVIIPVTQDMRLKADRRAKRLLQRFLTPEQKKMLSKQGYFDIFVEKPYRRTAFTKPLWDRELDKWLQSILRKPRFYRITDTITDAVYLRSAYSDHWQIYACVIPYGSQIPTFDHMFALKLMIEADERKFWNTALWHNEVQYGEPALAREIQHIP